MDWSFERFSDLLCSAFFADSRFSVDLKRAKPKLLFKPLLTSSSQANRSCRLRAALSKKATLQSLFVALHFRFAGLLFVSGNEPKSGFVQSAILIPKSMPDPILLRVPSLTPVPVSTDRPNRATDTGSATYGMIPPAAFSANTGAFVNINGARPSVYRFAPTSGSYYSAPDFGGSRSEVRAPDASVSAAWNAYPHLLPLRHQHPGVDFPVQRDPAEANRDHFPTRGGAADSTEVAQQRTEAALRNDSGYETSRPAGNAGSRDSLNDPSADPRLRPAGGNADLAAQMYHRHPYVMPMGMTYVPYNSHSAFAASHPVLVQPQQWISPFMRQPYPIRAPVDASAMQRQSVPKRPQPLRYDQRSSSFENQQAQAEHGSLPPPGLASVAARKDLQDEWETQSNASEKSQQRLSW